VPGAVDGHFSVTSTAKKADFAVNVPDFVTSTAVVGVRRAVHWIEIVNKKGPPMVGALSGRMGNSHMKSGWANPLKGLRLFTQSSQDGFLRDPQDL